MSAEKINPFDLNRTEYAELLGISPEAVRMRLRRGKLEGEYRFENGKYFEFDHSRIFLSTKEYINYNSKQTKNFTENKKYGKK